MADPTRVYSGGVPEGGFNAEMRNAGFGVSGEAESSETPGGPAKRPGVVSEGGSTQGKTHSRTASEAFLLDGSYKGDMSVGRPTSGQTRNPNDVSRADSN